MNVSSYSFKNTNPTWCHLIRLPPFLCFLLSFSRIVGVGLWSNYRLTIKWLPVGFGELDRSQRVKLQINLSHNSTVIVCNARLLATRNLSSFLLHFIVLRKFFPLTASLVISLLMGQNKLVLPHFKCFNVRCCYEKQNLFFP